VGNILMVMRGERTDLLVIPICGMSGWRAMVFGFIAEMDGGCGRQALCGEGTGEARKQ
jgi:hypothetical protein